MYNSVQYKIACLSTRLDLLGLYAEASELDEILSDLCGDDMFGVIDDLEAMEQTKLPPVQDQPKKKDIVPNSNGQVGNGLIDNPSSGMSQGLSGIYFSPSFGDLS